MKNYIVLEGQDTVELVKAFLDNWGIAATVIHGGLGTCSLATSLALDRKDSKILALIESHTTHPLSVAARLADLEHIGNVETESSICKVMLAVPQITDDLTIAARIKSFFK